MPDLPAVLRAAERGARWSRWYGAVAARRRACAARLAAWTGSFRFRYVCTMYQGVRLADGSLAFLYYILSADGRGRRRMELSRNDTRVTLDRHGSVYADWVAPWLLGGRTNDQMRAQAAFLARYDWSQ